VAFPAVFGLGCGDPLAGAGEPAVARVTGRFHGARVDAVLSRTNDCADRRWDPLAHLLLVQLP
jgi:hypothetical protein